MTDLCQGLRAMASTLEATVAHSPPTSEDLRRFLTVQINNCRNLATMLEGQEERLKPRPGTLVEALWDLAGLLEAKDGTAWAVGRASDCRVVARALEDLTKAMERRRKIT